MARRLGDRRGIADSLNHAAGIHLTRGLDLDRCQAMMLDARTHSFAISDEIGIAESTMNLSEVARLRRSWDAAEEYAAETVDLGTLLGNDLITGNAFTCLAYAVRMQGRLMEARDLYLASLEINQRLRFAPTLAYSLIGAGGALIASRNIVDGTRLMSAGLASMPETDADLARTDRIAMERDMAAARALIGDGWFEVSWLEGAEMPVDVAIQTAVELLGS
jgi:hypothetical protein